MTAPHIPSRRAAWLPRLSTAARWRWQVAARALTAIFGGYALTALASTTLALLATALSMPKVDAALTGMLSSFAIYAAAIIWSFSAGTLKRAWGGLLLVAISLWALRLLT